MLLTERGREEGKERVGKGGEEGEIADQEGEESSSFSLELSRGRRRGEILPPICTGRTHVRERQVENRLLRLLLNRVI